MKFQNNRSWNVASEAHPRHSRNFDKFARRCTSYKRIIHLYTFARSIVAIFRSIDRKWNWYPIAASWVFFAGISHETAVFWLVNFAALYEKYGGNGVFPLRGFARYTVPFLLVNLVRKRHVVNSFPMLAHVTVSSCACHPVAAHPLSDAPRCTCAIPTL